MPRREVYKSKRLKKVFHPQVNLDLREYRRLQSEADLLGLSISQLLRKAWYEFEERHSNELYVLNENVNERRGS